MSTKKNARVNIRIDDDIREWIDARANERRTDVSDIVRGILLDAYLYDRKHRIINGSESQRAEASR